MNGPARFKSALSPGLEGRLLAAGFQQQPEPDSLKRAAERLGLPPGLLATSAAAVAVSAASSTTAAAAGKLSALGGLGLVGATKAAIIGVSIGVGVAVGSTVLSVTHKPSPVNARPSSAQSVLNARCPCYNNRCSSRGRAASATYGNRDHGATRWLEPERSGISGSNAGNCTERGTRHRSV